MEALRALKRHITLKRVLIILILLVVVSPTISYYHRNMPPSVQTEEQDPIAGETGYSVERRYCDPLRNVTIYDGLVSDTGANWHMDDREIGPLERYGVLSVTEDDEGFRVHLEGLVTSSYYAGDSQVAFSGRPVLPVANYSDLLCSASVTVLQGAANLSFYAYYNEPYQDTWRDGANTTATLEAGETSTLSLHPSIANLHNLTTSWVTQCLLRMGLRTTQESIVSIGRVTITASSYEDLYPVSFDIQAPDGKSLFSNHYTDKMGGYTRLEWTYHQFYKLYPGFLMTYFGSEDPGFYVPTGVNHTVYLRPGNYSGSVGWFRLGNYIHPYPHRASDLNITVEAYEFLSVQARIPASELKITASPAATYTGIRVATNLSIVLYDIDYPLVGSDSLYLPPTTYIRVTIAHSVYNGIPYTVDPLYTQSSARIDMTKLPDSSVVVRVEFPMYSILGLVLDAGQLIGLLSLSTLLLIPISVSLRNQYSAARGISHLLVPLALFTSAFTPWVNYSFETLSYPATKVNAAVFVPLVVTFWYGPGTLVTPVPNTYLHPNLLALSIFYWIPIIIMLFHMVTNRVRDVEGREIPSSMHQGFAIMMGPLLIGSYYLWFCFLGLCTPGVGLIAVLLTFPLWVSYGAIRKYKRHQMSKAHPDLE